MSTTQQHDIVDEIIADHRQVEAVFGEIENSSDPSNRRELVEHVITELVRHSVGEEQYLYPTARNMLPDGEQVADHELKEHAEAEEVMKELENTDEGDPKFDALVRTLIDTSATTSQMKKASCCPSCATRVTGPS
jgi:hemerythrin superfamily protein